MSDQFANWTEERPCQCSERNYFTTSLAWEEVPMLSVEHEIVLGVGRLAVLGVGRLALNHFTRGGYERLRIKDLTHEAVQATIKCTSCGAQFHRTYELKGEVNGKRNRWGHYGIRRNEKRHSALRFSLEHLEKCYAQMWENYHLVSRNCAHWAAEFWAKVVGPAGDEECCIM